MNHQQSTGKSQAAIREKWAPASSLSVAIPIAFITQSVQAEERRASAHTWGRRTGWQEDVRELPRRITAAAAEKIAGSIAPLITRAANYHAKHREL